MLALGRRCGIAVIRYRAVHTGAATVDGKYRVLREIGMGGMGAVYEAEHLGTGRRVALKVLNADALTKDKDVLTRFRREARASGAIQSPHVVQVLDSGVDPSNDSPYLVMELLVGEDLHELCDRLGPLPPDLVLRIAAQACLGLSRVHDAGILHRDVKSANVHLSRSEGERIVKLLDFGLAKVRTDPLGIGPLHDVTKTGSVVGSPFYMSPEQAKGKKAYDGRTDIFSLGVLMYEALTGTTPHAMCTTIADLVVAVATRPADPLQSRAPWVPSAIADIIHTALALDPERRHPSAAAMRGAIMALLPNGCAIGEDLLVGVSPEVRARAADLGQPSGIRGAAPPRVSAPDRGMHGDRTEVDPARDPFGLVGSVLADKFRVTGVIGEGGFGVVYEGQHLALGAPVAIKCLKPRTSSAGGDERDVDAFVREARVLFTLGHPAIVRFYETGVLDHARGRVPWVVLERLTGTPLDLEIRARARARRPFDLAELRAIFEPILEGLAFAHEHGVVHRDLKPANLMLSRVGLGIAPKILDFGTARATWNGEHTADATGFTPLYAAPEQWDPTLGTIGPATDVFAMGLTLVEACVLAPPHAGTVQIGEVLRAVMDPTRRPDLRRLRPDLPAALADLAVQAMRLRPEERFSDGGAMLRAFREAVAPHAPAPRPRTWGPAVTAGGIVGLVLALVLAVFVVQRLARGRDAASLDELAAVAPPPGVMARGAPVLAQWEGTIFQEGRVAKVDGDRVTVAWSDRSKAREIDRAFVLLVPRSGSAPAFQAGDVVLARRRIGELWHGAEVTHVGGAVQLRFVDESEAHLEAHAVIGAPASIAVDIKNEMRAAGIRRVAAAGLPWRPPAYRPVPGQKVVATWIASSWYSGAVTAVGDDKATIAWADGSAPSQVVLERIAPEPGPDTPAAHQGEFVLARSSAGSTWRWGQVSSVASAQVEVYMADGSKETRAARDYLVMQR